MNTFTIFSFKNKREVNHIEKYFLKKFEKDEKNPDFVVVFGGDGTLLESEKKYPEVPKLCIRNNTKRNEFHKKENIEEIITKIEKKEYKIKNIDKIKAIVNEKIKSMAMNDVYIHNIPQKALRFSLKCEDKNILFEINEAIGDGLIVSTAHGSKAYFFSINGFSFEKGFGFSFNNIHKNFIYPLILSENFEIWVKLIRENGHLICDNRIVSKVKRGDIVKIEKAEEKAKIILVI